MILSDSLTSNSSKMILFQGKLLTIEHLSFLLFSVQKTHSQKSMLFSIYVQYGQSNGKVAQLKDYKQK